MGRPEKLTKEQQAEALASIKAGQQRMVVAMKYGISEITLRRYEKLNAEFVAGQKAEQMMVAQEVAQEMNPEAA